MNYLFSVKNLQDPLQSWRFIWTDFKNKKTMLSVNPKPVFYWLMQTYMAARVFVWTNGIVVVVKVVFFYCRRPPHFSDAAEHSEHIFPILIWF